MLRIRRAGCGVYWRAIVPPDDADEEAAIQWFTALEPAERASFLANVAHRLTVAARDCYQFQAPGVTDPLRLREMNELQHYVTSYLGHVLRGTEDQSWAPFIVKRLLVNDDPTIGKSTRWAWQSSGGKGIAVQ
jgi:hypothetical protein